MREGQNVNEKKQMSSNGEGKVNVTKVLKGLHTKAKKKRKGLKKKMSAHRQEFTNRLTSSWFFFRK